jgi:CHAT domain-containing protein
MFVVDVLWRMATVDTRAGRLDQARESLLSALEVSGSVGNPNQSAVLLQSLARIERQRGNLDAALEAIREAVLVVEDLRVGLANLDLRASFFARKEPIHESYVDLLMELHARAPDAGYDIAAFEASERGRSRSFLDSLVGGGASEGPALDARERAYEIKRQIAGLGARLVRLEGTDPTSPEHERIQARLQELEEEFRRVEIDLATTSTLSGRPLTLAEIQRDVLDADTALLQFSLGRERSFLWHVAVDGISSFVLPPRAELENAVTELYRLVTAPYSFEDESARERSERLERADRRRPVIARRLSEDLLAPLAHLLDERRLVIVADGALHQLPFGLLPDPAQPEQPLLASREVVPIPSASVLERLRRRPRSAAAQQVAVVADPVYGSEDPRVGGFFSRAFEWFDRRAPELAPTQEIVLRSARGLGFDPFRRLDFTRDEEEIIRRLVGRRPLFSALDFDASRETVFSERFAASRIVHIATHAILHPETPGLSGIVLSLVDEKGRPRDGYLRLHDIYDLDLQAELVVLSACRTGLGKSVAGEGPLGLPRAFLSAGAPRVVASLWSVDDLATSQLMTRFYTHLLGDRLAPGAALAATQRSLWQEGRPPAEWAGFVLIGDWR